VSVARSAGQEGTVVDVVQIGGRTPERIPEIGPDGKMVGYRKDEDGKVLTTAMSAEGESQLEEVAKVSGGKLVRSERGTTGIDTVSQDLKRKMTEELAEQVETIYADVYMYPLGAALALLVVEVFISESAKRGGKGKGTGAGKGAGGAKGAGRTKVAGAAAAMMVLGAGCGWNPSRPFERQAPEVKSAVVALDAGDAGAAARVLEEYLATGSCEEGGFGIPDKVRERPNASFDLGLALFQLAERFGQRFGEEGRAGDAGPTPEEQALAELRSTEVECALRVVLQVASDTDLPLELRARAQYLAGNLEFLRGQSTEETKTKGYEEAVRHYDESLKITPGLVDGGDAIGQDAAWNRAIALFRIEEEKKKDSGAPDAGPRDASSDRQSSPDGSPEHQEGGSNDPHKDGGSPSQPDAGDQNDAQSQANNQEGQDAAQPQEPPPSINQDQRMLDKLESAPTFQQEEAKQRAAQRRFRGKDDK
jgi:hypothetical protein